MSKLFSTYRAIKYQNGKLFEVNDQVTTEKALQISINDIHFAVVMQTPGDEINLVTGLLFSEDVIDDKTKISFETKISDDKLIQEVNCLINSNEIGDGYKNSRSLLSVSSCGICGKKDLEDLKLNGEKLTQLLLDSSFIFGLKKQMQINQPVFPITGSTHGAALFNKKGSLLGLKEDIGRHNALDKSIGELLIKGKLKEAKILFFSGRLSFEIIFKCFRAKISTIIAISAPSSLAIDFAKEFGITLYGFCRDDRYTRYA
ncbi:MAG TPA: formate dehydrogenase accessory sulfurtransferase FdhD [Crocinitomix sp.]|nr:formate dehydrogenase accessory sulfurtransferase FdhD [Crocinitomix sp.]